MAKYAKQQWITAEETYKNTGSYIKAESKSGIPVNNIKVNSIRKNWKPEKDENVYRMYTEIAYTIRQETKEEIKTVLEKVRTVQDVINKELPLCENQWQKAALFNAYIKSLWIEGKITKELVNSLENTGQVEMKPLLGGESVKSVKNLFTHK